jgi:hypothetical protein
LLICARKGCDEEFSPKTHNQKYHNDECCRLATNARIMEKYYARRDQRLGKIRICDECNVTKLSRYNNSLTCSSCDLKKEITVNAAVLNMLTVVSWQS